MKKSIIIGIAIMMCLAFAASAQAAYPTAKVLVDGQEIPTEAIIVQGNTMVPLRELGEICGYYVIWDQLNKTVLYINNDNTIDVTIGSDLAIVNRQPKKLSIAPMLYNNKTMVPLRFIAEIAEMKVSWDSNKVLITSPAKNTSDTADSAEAKQYQQKLVTLTKKVDAELPEYFTDFSLSAGNTYEELQNIGSGKTPKVVDCGGGATILHNSIQYNYSLRDSQDPKYGADGREWWTDREDTWRTSDIVQGKESERRDIDRATALKEMAQYNFQSHNLKQSEELPNLKYFNFKDPVKADLIYVEGKATSYTTKALPAYKPFIGIAEIKPDLRNQMYMTMAYLQTPKGETLDRYDFSAYLCVKFTPEFCQEAKLDPSKYYWVSLVKGLQLHR